MLFINVTEVTWVGTRESTGEITSIEFRVFKKGVFGKLKEVREYEGSCLCFTHDQMGEIILDSFVILDGNFQALPIDPQLLNSILITAQEKMIGVGETQKAEILIRAAKGYFKKYVLKQ
jgi:hypothetical protein